MVYLQETFLEDKNKLNIKHLQSYNRKHKNEHRASGDVSILVMGDIPQQQININGTTYPTPPLGQDMTQGQFF